jgi:hypothetical protein
MIYFLAGVGILFLLLLFGCVCYRIHKFVMRFKCPSTTQYYGTTLHCVGFFGHKKDHCSKNLGGIYFPRWKEWDDKGNNRIVDPDLDRRETE